jgi:hypothetical protein
MTELHGWTCFHCGDHFPQTEAGRREAREHFGRTPEWPPACVERRTRSHADLVDDVRRLRWEASQSLANAIAVEEHFEAATSRIAEAERRLGVARLEDAVHELATLRVRLQDAEAFSRVVHRLRPTCWHVAMVDAYGPGEYFPPAEPKPAAPSRPTLAPGTIVVLDANDTAEAWLKRNGDATA